MTARKDGTRSDSRGRVEMGLEKELLERSDVGPAERAALRAQARAIDVAESNHDPRAVTEANRAYLDLRTACGMVAGAGPVVDSFDRLLAELGGTATDVQHAADT